MKAMILAAGLGTRLKPLTNDRPKALVEVAGHTLLEIALKRLHKFGVREVIVNVHHFAEMIVDYLKANDSFGMRVEISREPVLLDTGGGLKNAAHFFLDSASREEPFLLHNVDIISTFDLEAMLRFHAEHNALATIAVQHRKTSRYLLFDEQGTMCGRRHTRNASDEIARPSSEVHPLAYACIQVISPKIFSKLEEQGAFPIFNSYLRLAAQGERLLAFRADECYWRDVGRPETIAQASQDLADGKFSLSL